MPKNEVELQRFSIVLNKISSQSINNYSFLIGIDLSQFMTNCIYIFKSKMISQQA